MSNETIEDERRTLLYNIRVRLLKDKVKVKDLDIQLELLVSVSAEVKADGGRAINYVLIPLDCHIFGGVRER